MFILETLDKILYNSFINYVSRNSKINKLLHMSDKISIIF